MAGRSLDELKEELFNNIRLRLGDGMVDIEADGPIPGDYSMVCFGAIIVGHLGPPGTGHGLVEVAGEEHDRAWRSDGAQPVEFRLVVLLRHPVPPADLLEPDGLRNRARRIQLIENRATHIAAPSPDRELVRPVPRAGGAVAVAVVEFRGGEQSLVGVGQRKREQVVLTFEIAAGEFREIPGEQRGTAPTVRDDVQRSHLAHIEVRRQHCTEQHAEPIGHLQSTRDVTRSERWIVDGAVQCVEYVVTDHSVAETTVFTTAARSPTPLTVISASVGAS